jgi:hypothetical protein
VYWQDRDDQSKQSLKGGFGWTITSANAYKGAGFSCINNCIAPKDIMVGEVFLHEWLHQLEAFYGPRGAWLPKGGLHGNSNYGFKEDRNGSWNAWYKAFINAELKNPDGRPAGLGERAWQLGTMRDDFNMRRPEFLTSAHRKANLLTNPSFEEGTTGWAIDASGAAATIVDDPQPTRSKTLRLRSAAGTQLKVTQNVRGDPNSRYLLSGWVRTEKVPRGDEADGRPGAQIWVAHKAKFLRTTDFVFGDHDWIYRAVIFGTGPDRTEVEVGCRTSGGTDWFDDLALIKLSDLLPAQKVNSKGK